MFNSKFFLFVIFSTLLEYVILINADNLNLSNEIEQRAEASDLSIFDERVDELPSECSFASPTDCESATECTKRSGIYNVVGDDPCGEPTLVLCDAETADGGWLIIHKRQDGSQDFYRNWTEYENGFGDIDGEFFIGLKELYVLTNKDGPQELMILLEDKNGTKAYAKYDSFAIADQSESYMLKRVGKYSGTAGNSLSSHVNMKFSTKDKDNDIDPDYNCAEYFTGAWWYSNCHTSNLNGKYGDNKYGKGIIWFTFSGHTQSLPYVKMMIRRSRRV